MPVKSQCNPNFAIVPGNYCLKTFNWMKLSENNAMAIACLKASHLIEAISKEAWCMRLITPYSWKISEFAFVVEIFTRWVIY